MIINLRPLGLQCSDMCLDALGHIATARNDEPLVACTGSSFEHPVLIRDTHEQTLRDVVAVETGTVNV